MVFTADAEGRCEVFTWDAAALRARRVTDRPHGTLHGAIDHDGHVWWFDEDDDGSGRWRFQPFAGGPDLPGLLGVPEGESRGLAVSDDAHVAMGLGDARSTTVHFGRRGATAREVTRVDGHATLSGITRDGSLLAVSAAAGSARAVTVLAADGTPHAVLAGDGPDGRLWALGFAPVADRIELLLVRETNNRYELASWSPDGGTVTHSWCAFDTEITARWHPEGRSVLVRQDRYGRSTLHRVHLAERTVEPVPTPRGTLLDAAPRTGDDVHYLWTDTATPPRMISTAGTALPPPTASAQGCRASTATCGRRAPTARCTRCSACPTGTATRCPRCSSCTAGPPTTTGTPTTGWCTPSSPRASPSSASTTAVPPATGRAGGAPSARASASPRWPTSPRSAPTSSTAASSAPTRPACGAPPGAATWCSSPSARSPRCGRRVWPSNPSPTARPRTAPPPPPCVPWTSGCSAAPPTRCPNGTSGARPSTTPPRSGPPPGRRREPGRQMPARPGARLPHRLAPRGRTARVDVAGHRPRRLRGRRPRGRPAPRRGLPRPRTAPAAPRRRPQTPRSDRAGDTGRVRLPAPAGQGTTHTERSSCHAEGHHPQ